jgi:hypothetical protein
MLTLNLQSPLFFFGAGVKGMEMEVMRRMKEWVKEVFGDIPRAYPLSIVFSYASREVKPVIDSSTPILSESITWYINFDDPFAKYDDDHVLAFVELPDGTIVDCTPANFLQPECIRTYYRHSFARVFLDFSRPANP